MTFERRGKYGESYAFLKSIKAKYNDLPYLPLLSKVMLINIQCSTLPPSVKPNWLSYLTPLSSRNSSIFCLKIVQIILLLFTVTAIGLCSKIFGLSFLGIIVVLDTNQS